MIINVVNIFVYIEEVMNRLTKVWILKFLIFLNVIFFTESGEK